MTVTAFQQANQLLREGKLEESVVAYRQAIEHNPQFYGAYQNLGETLGKLGRLDEAVEMYRKAIELKPEAGWLHQELGLLFEKLDRSHDAVFELRKAAELCPRSAVVLQQLGEAFMKLGQSSEATEAYRRAKELNPRLLDLHGDWQKLQANDRGLSSVPEVERNLTVTSIQDCILQYATMQKKLKSQDYQETSTLFKPISDTQDNKNNKSKQIYGHHPIILFGQSEAETGLIQEDEKYTLALRLSGIVEDIQKDSKPEVIEKLETLHHSYDNPGCIDWEKVLELGYRLFLSSNSTVIDIGGHAGRHSDIFINQIGAKQVYIFEPIPSKYEHLVNRYSSNPNVTVKQVALSSSVGKSEFLINHGAPEESGLKERIYNNPELKNLEKIVVATDTLDNLFIDSPGVEYIKIDTEGGEIDILKGAVSLLHKFRPFISVEYGKPSYTAYGHNQDTLFLYCQKQAYVITDLFGNPIESIDIWRECVDSFYWDYYLVPQEKLSFFCQILTGKVIEVVR
ncbi:UDP-N-acetylglucosamine--peptide N-acetylglucosaminyltransferase 110 kDa subunit [Planktothrix agardhii]|uniref:protein arginine N-methyltransferase n=1 Tax=Planktothrix agardhii TaxID=1160 RepID=UPI0020A6FD30|nr:protein arginine N-methyltransferase [Planktothrix agardhii]CAD5926169.1 UDP-N-acetylglucosamine--peptide N-acetylglucosaminyltransferase 110 kDa subunit [Planktothrix agardhii]